MSVERISAAEAASRLGVKRETIYAYVSRGRLHSERHLDGKPPDSSPRTAQDSAQRLSAGIIHPAPRPALHPTSPTSPSASASASVGSCIAMPIAP